MHPSARTLAIANPKTSASDSNTRGEPSSRSSASSRRTSSTKAGSTAIDQPRRIVIAKQLARRAKRLHERFGINTEVDVEIFRQKRCDYFTELARLLRRAAGKRICAIRKPGVAQIFNKGLAEF